MALGREKILWTHKASQISHARGCSPHRTSSHISSGKSSTSAAYMEPEQRAAREFWYLNQRLFLIRGLETLSARSSWDCLLQGCLPQWGKDSRALPSGDKPRLNGVLQLYLPSFAVTASLGEPASSPAGACATAVTPCAVIKDVGAQLSQPPGR